MRLKKLKNTKARFLEKLLSPRKKDYDDSVMSLR